MNKSLVWSIALILVLVGGSYYIYQLNNKNVDGTREKIPATGNVVNGGCYAGGCSGQICSDQPDPMSTCEYKEEYACYKATTCERQSDGQCGWTDNEAFNTCIDAVLESGVNIK